MVVAHGLEFLETPWDQRESVLPLPIASWSALFHLQHAILRRNAKLVSILFLFDSGPEPQRIEKRLSETNIRQPWFFQIYTQCQMIKLRSAPAAFTWHAR